jgi:NADH-ubiquinone oxidoreductase chain 5
MLLLVSADNFVQLFIGWECVGFASFLLISFWFTRLQAGKAAIQAMVVNRIGDLGLILAIACLYLIFQSTDYRAIFCSNYFLVHSQDQNSNLLNVACILLFIGAVGKSGQFGLHMWLPNAMNAPTPVSALLHAATMVTAGVFLLARASPLIEYAGYASAIVVIVGAITTVFAGTVGLVQNDFKSIIAYSTCSQLGFMVTVCGLSNYEVGIFHLLNHAFFKALLFLTAGNVIHVIADEQDVRKLGNLQKTLLFSYTMLLIGTLSIVGTPFLSAFYSKDIILELSSARYEFISHFVSILTCFSVLTTSFYSFRLLSLVFLQPDNESSKLTNLSKTSASMLHDANWVIALVLIMLALGSVYSGWLFKSMFVGLGTDFWNNSMFLNPENSFLVESEFLPLKQKLIPLLCTVIGALLAFLSTTLVDSNYKLSSKTLKWFYDFLSSRWYYDKIVNQTVALPCYKLGYNLIKTFDKGLFETMPVLGVASGLPQNIKAVYSSLATMQSGQIFHYAMIITLSTIFILYVLTQDVNSMCLDYRLSVLLFVCLGF